MFDPILILAVLATVLLGSVLLRILRAERRSAELELRLSTIAGTASNSGGPILSLRRSTSRGKAFPMALAAPFELAFAATGNRIGPLHLAVTGVIAAVTTGFFSVTVFPLPALAITLAVASGTGFPTLLLRFAQSRYQRQFLDAFPEALDLIVRAVRSGLPAPEAIELVTREIRAPVGAEFQTIID